MLKYGDPDTIRQMFVKMQDDVLSIVDGVIELCYYMRGSIGYEEMMFRTPGERQRIAKFIEKRLDSQKKLMNPVY